MIRRSTADYQFEARRHATEVVFAGLRRHPGRAEYSRHVRVLHIGADPDPRVEAEVGAAVQHKPRMADVDVLAGLVEARRFLILVSTGTRGDVRPNPRRDLEPVTGGDFERRQRCGERNPQLETLTVADERALAGLLEAGRRQFDEELFVKDHLNAAAEERLVRLAEHRIERVDG